MTYANEVNCYKNWTRKTLIFSTTLVQVLAFVLVQNSWKNMTVYLGLKSAGTSAHNGREFLAFIDHIGCFTMLAVSYIYIYVALVMYANVRFARLVMPCSCLGSLQYGHIIDEHVFTA
jgi:hypothetical protein